MSAIRRRIRFDLAYDGTDFHGWQMQARERTVQGVLTEALERIQGEGGLSIRGASRTDAGVHARAQVADTLIATRLADEDLMRSLVCLLPPDLRPVGVRTVSERFHSRHQARSKTYRYTLDRSEAADPFLARYALHHPHPIDRAALADALARLPGRRDWTGFAASKCEKEDRVRDLTAAWVEETDAATMAFGFSADGFLTHMVRNLVGTLLEVARGRVPPDRIDRILEAGDRSLAGATAPAHGLCLASVTYAPETESV